MKKLINAMGNLSAPLFVFLTLLFASCSSGNSGGGSAGGGGDNGGGGKPATVNISANPAWYNGTLVFNYTTANTISLQKDDGTQLPLGTGTVSINNVTSDYTLKLTAVGSNNTTYHPEYTGKVYDDATSRLCKVEGTADSLFTVTAHTINGTSWPFSDTLRFRTDHTVYHYGNLSGSGPWQLSEGLNAISMFTVNYNFQFTELRSFKIWYTNSGGQLVETWYAK